MLHTLKLQEVRKCRCRERGTCNGNPVNILILFTCNRNSIESVLRDLPLRQMEELERKYPMDFGSKIGYC